MIINPSTLYKIWNWFLCLFSGKPSLLVTEILSLLAKFPDRFEAYAADYDGEASLCIAIIPGTLTEIMPALGSVIVIQKKGVFIDHPTDGLQATNRRETTLIGAALEAWSKTE